MNKLVRIIESNLINIKNKNYVYEKKDGVFVPITFGRYIDRVKNIADFLLKKGYGKQRIGIIAVNSINYMAFDLAIMSYVGTSVCINTYINKEELISLINRIQLKCIVYSKEFFDLLSDISEIDKIEIDSFNNEIPNINIISNVKETDCIKVIFSSGSTGKSKGVMLSMNNIFSCLDCFNKRTIITNEEREYTFLPFFHGYGGIYNALYTFIYGIELFLCSDKKNIIEEILEVNPTLFCTVPIIIDKFLIEYNDKELKKCFGKNIKYLYVAGAKLSIEKKKKFSNLEFKIIEAYGLSETTCIISQNYYYDSLDESSGTIYEIDDCKILNKDNDGFGEIVVKGPNVFIGYIDDDELYENSFTSDGYFCTNDIGKIINNKLYIKERKNSNVKLSNGNFKNDMSIYKN